MLCMACLQLISHFRKKLTTGIQALAVGFAVGRNPRISYSASKAKEISMSELSIETKAKAAKEYLEKDVVPMLTKALAKMCVEEPEDPYTWLAKYLIENHPTKPAQIQHHESLVLTLQEGSFFGEIALLSGKPRQATVKASGVVSVLVIGRDAFDRLCGSLIDILQRNMSNYSNMELPETAPDVEKDTVVSTPVPAPQDTARSTESEVEAPKPAATGKRARRRGSVFVEAVEIDSSWVAPTYPHTAEELERLDGYVAKTILLSLLDTQAKKSVIGAFQKRTYQATEDIITQGADGDYYYILDSGHADVWISKNGAPETKVFEYSPGGAFGELALLHGEPRLATVRASEDCVCWALDRDTFRKIMMSTGRQDMNERTTFLSKVPVLQELTQFEKFKIAEAMEVRNFKDGDVIVEEGAEGNEFFVIQKGTVKCYKRLLKF